MSFVYRIDSMENGQTVTLFVGSSSRDIKHLEAMTKFRLKHSELPLYEKLREHGGWGNMSINVCQTYEHVKDRAELKKHEKEWFQKLDPVHTKKKATLSRVEYGRQYRARKPRNNAHIIDVWRLMNPEKARALRVRENAARRAKRAMKSAQIQERGLVKIDDR